MSRAMVIRTILLVVSVIAGFGVLLSSAAAQDSDMSASNPVQRFSDGSEVEGSWATLNRYENGLLMALHTSDLSPDEVYTVWWVVFNEPGNCSDGACGEDDIFVFEDGQIVLDENNNPSLNMEGVEAAQISALYASGSLVGDDGTGNFGGSAGTGDTPGIIFGPGVLNPMTAEVHLVVRTHGPVIEGEFDAQITSFGGGCGPTDNGLPCADHQFAVFAPPVQ